MLDNNGSGFGMAVRGIGAVGGFGCGRDALRRQLISPREAEVKLKIKTRHGVRTVPAFLADPRPLAEIVKGGQLRRLDRYSRMVTLAAALALADHREKELDRRRIGMILATGYGANETTFRFLDGCLDYGDRAASPLLFSGSGHSGALSNATIMLNIEGPLLTICQPCLPVTTALQAASAWLCENRVDAVLAGGADEYIPLVGYARVGGQEGKQRGLAKKVPDRANQPIGEGASFLLLTRDHNPPAGTSVRLDRVEFARGLQTASLIPTATEVLINPGSCGPAPDFLQQLKRITPNRYTDCQKYYGSLPTATAFNLAIAAIRLAEGPRSEDDFNFKADLPALSCLETTDRSDECGLIVLARLS